MLASLKRAVLGSSTLDLRRLILLLALISAFLMLANSLFASYRVQREVLIEKTLETNYVYATKVALTVDEFLHSAQQQLQYAAGTIANHYDDHSFLQAEAVRLKRQTDSFNSVAIVDDTGVVRATDPDLRIIGDQLGSAGALQSLGERKPLISPPFVSHTGKLLLTVSQPVFDANENYLGYISGTIYLEEPSTLNRVLRRSSHRDRSYLYVIDSNRRLLYHPQAERVGTIVGANLAVDDIAAGKSGMMRVINSQGIDMLAGYALVAGTDWGIVLQLPVSDTLKPLSELLTRVLLNALPLALLIALIIWRFARAIAQPLRRLAESATTMDRPETTSEIKQTLAWYFETANLKKALLAGIELMHGKINKLSEDVQTDSLTGLSNRRAFDYAIENWRDDHRAVSLVTADVDHFKRVNDTYGHDMGDEVLRRLSNLMRSCSRSGDLLCRIGGEEFALLLPDTDLTVAGDVAERLRQLVERTPFDPVGNITISLGVAHWPLNVQSIDELLKRSDEALYRAKRNGRNRVETAT
ncbi:GGDEF domain-containing protein [Alcaligenaceae bacterium]|nr:GGDEF domain-containing protein [Alcaligenaceae bacterium]